MKNLLTNTKRNFECGDSIYQHCIDLHSSKESWLFTFAISFITVLLALATYVESNIYANKSFAYAAYSLLFSILVICLVWKGIGVRRESLLIVHSLGLQTTTAYIVGRKSTIFISWSSIHDIIINEAVCGFRIIHYLAVILKNEGEEERLLPLFMNSKPRLPELIKIYGDVQTILGQ